MDVGRASSQWRSGSVTSMFQRNSRLLRPIVGGRDQVEGTVDVSKLAVDDGRLRIGVADVVVGVVNEVDGPFPLRPDQKRRGHWRLTGHDDAQVERGFLGNLRHEQQDGPVWLAGLDPLLIQRRCRRRRS